MGILAKTDREARSVLARGNRKPGVSMTKSTHQLLDELPKAMRRKVLTKAVRQAGGIVRKDAKVQLASKRSRTTGTREGWSAKVRSRREGGWDLWQSMGVRTRNYRQNSGDGVVVAMVGPRWPWGAHGHLVELGGYHPYWGRLDGEYEPPFPFMRRSSQQTMSRQEREIISTTRRDWLST